MESKNSQKLIEDSKIRIASIISNELENLYKNINENSEYEIEISNYKEIINKKNTKIVELESIITSLKEEQQGFTKVSMISSLNNAVIRKDEEISKLNTKVKSLQEKLKTFKDKPKYEISQSSPSNTNISLNSDHVSHTSTVSESNEKKIEINDEVDDDELEDEEVEDVLEVKIKKKYYYVSDNKIYEKLDDGEMGDIIGEYINGKPKFKH